MKLTHSSILAIAVSALVIVSAVVGLIMAGSPGLERKYRLDEQRLSNLETIRYNIIEQYYSSQKKLPETLDQASAVGQYATKAIRDPETGKAYEYHIVSEQTYTLCAEFDLPTNPDRQTYPTLNHSAGRTCFTFSVGKSDPSSVKAQPVTAGTIE